jgi:hypothetical protein
MAHDGRNEPALSIHPCPRQGQTLHCKPGSFYARRARFEVLKAIELTRPETPRSKRRAHDNLDDRGCEALDLVNCCPQQIVELS